MTDPVSAAGLTTFSGTVVEWAVPVFMPPFCWRRRCSEPTPGQALELAFERAVERRAQIPDW
jgi:hypothetical protein